jgi:hypothetical protein
MKSRIIPVVVLWVVFLFLATFAQAQSGPEIPDNTVDEDGDGWINMTDYKIRSSRPRLFVTTDNLGVIRERAASSHTDEYKALLNACNTSCLQYSQGNLTRRPSVGYICAFLYQINKDGMISVPGVTYEYSADDFAAVAKDIVVYYSDEAMNYDYHTDYLFAFDWIYEYIMSDSSLMLDLHRKLLIRYGYNGPDSYSFRHDFQAYYISAGASNALYYALTAIGDSRPVDLDIWSDGYHKDVLDEHFDTSDEAALRYIHRSLYNFNPNDDNPVSWVRGLVPAQNLAAADDGGYPEGSAYELGYVQGFFQFLTAWEGATADERAIRTNNRVMYDPLFWLYLAREYGYRPWRYQVTFDDNRNYTPLTAGLTSWYQAQSLRPPLFAHIHYASKYGLTGLAGLSQWLLQNRISDRAYVNWSNLMALIYHDKSVQPQSPTDLNLPLSKVFGGSTDTYEGKKAGMGYLIMRSSWDPANVLHAGFKSSPWIYCGHIHPNDGTFFINLKEDLVIGTSGTYENGDDYLHEREYFRRTIGGNNLLIYDSNEFYPGVYKLSAINDGGQFRQGQISRYYRAVNGMPQSRAGLVKTASTARYDYAGTNLAKQYNLDIRGTDHNKVDQYWRHFFWLKSRDQLQPDIGNYFVVYDQVKTTDDRFDFRWLLHLQGEPVIDGDYINLDGHYGHVQEYSAPTLAESTVRSARVYLKPLLPKNIKIRKVGGDLSNIPAANLDNVTNQSIANHFLIGFYQPVAYPDEPDISKAFRLYARNTFLTIDDSSLQLSGDLNITLPFSQYPSIQDVIDELYQIANSANDYCSGCGISVKQTGTYGLALYDYTIASHRSGYGALRDHSGYWRVEVIPAARNSQETFLNVIVPTSAPGIIIDNNDSRCIKSAPDLVSSTKEGDFKFMGEDFNVMRKGSGSGYVEYRFSVPQDGQYTVSVTVPTISPSTYNRMWSGRSVPYLITSASGQTQVVVDQYKVKGNWKELGTFPFFAGKTYTVRVEGQTSQDVFIDALKVEQAGTVTPNLPDMSLVQSLSGGPFEGVLISALDQDPNKCLMFAREFTAPQNVSYRVDADGTIEHHLVGLPADMPCTVYDHNHTLVHSGSTTAEGILSFESEGGGIFSVNSDPVGPQNVPAHPANLRIGAG